MGSGSRAFQRYTSQPAQVSKSRRNLVKIVREKGFITRLENELDTLDDKMGKLLLEGVKEKDGGDVFVSPKRKEISKKKIEITMTLNQHKKRKEIRILNQLISALMTNSGSNSERKKNRKDLSHSDLR